MTTGTLSGEGLAAKPAMPGGDWMTVSTDDFSCPDQATDWED